MKKLINYNLNPSKYVKQTNKGSFLPVEEAISILKKTESDLKIVNEDLNVLLKELGFKL